MKETIKNIITIIIILFLTINISNAQNKEIDSLNHVIVTTINDTTKINSLFFIAELTYAYNPDTAIIVCKEALKLSEKINFNEGITNSLVWLGYLLNQQGNAKTAISYYEKTLKIAPRNTKKEKELIAITLNNIAYIYDLQGSIAFALNYYTKALKIAEDIENTMDITTYLSNIALIYKTQGDSTKAIEYINRALKIQRENNDEIGIANSLRYLGQICTNKGQTENAIKYYNEALKYAEKHKAINSMAFTLISFGNLYSNKKEYDKAIQYFEKALQYQLSINNKEGIEKSTYYLGKTFFLQNKTDKAKSYALKSIKIAKVIGYPVDIRNNAMLLSEIYQKQKKWKNAYEMYKLSIIMKDSIRNEINKKETFRQQIKYEYDKKASIDSIAFSKEIEIKNIETKRSKEQRNYLIFGFGIVVFMLFFIYRSFLHKKKANIILNRQKNEIQEKNIELNLQKKEIQAQADYLHKANIEISKSHKNITDSINYAKKIQTALLPCDKLLKQHIPEHFVLYKPKDIVSGDFYYFKKVNNYMIIAVADCTGHGVPGAFVSMLGIAFLNEIIRKKEVRTAAQTLESLRVQVKTSLNRNNTKEKTSDGMDIALCVINSETNMLEYAGAYNPLYIIRNNELTELKATRNPIGIYKNEKLFKNNKIQLQNDDVLYMFSDGYKDQFAEKDNKKFSSKKFKELLLKIHKKTPEEQKNILDKTIVNWIGKKEQIDDILVLGMKVTNESIK